MGVIYVFYSFQLLGTAKIKSRKLLREHKYYGNNGALKESEILKLVFKGGFRNLKY
jgi:hypothetical protein